MDPRQKRAAALAAAQKIVDGAKAAARDLTKDEQADVEKHLEAVKECDAQIEAERKSADLMGRLTGAQNVSFEDEQAEAEKAHLAGTLGERFVKSDAFQEFCKSHPNGPSKSPFEVKVGNIGDIADLGIGSKATITTQTGQPSPTRLPGYTSTLLDEPIAFLNLISTGSTNSAWLEYAQITGETNGADIVAEGELKPLSDITTAKAEAKAHVYADGFDVTNQELADDKALVSIMEQRIRWHVRNKVEDTLINGDASSNVRGILNTTGTQAQAFDTDVVTTLAAALAKVEAVQVAPQAIVMNPADAWKLALSKEAGVGYLMGNPLAQSLNPTPFGVRLVKSNRVAAGTALVGNFSSVFLLEREPLSVVAFNQHKDYAQRNMAYVRCEMRALQMFRSPRDIVVADLAA